MKRLSIIVPIYNVEPFVERCIRSIEEQDIPKEDYEIICINDGSPDNSRDVIVTLKKKWNNIVLIDQENQGVSMARNNGIDLARGKYVLMVDADDFIKPNILKNRLEILDKNNLEVGFCGYTILNEAFIEEYIFDPIYDSNIVQTGIDFFNTFKRGRSEIRDPHSSWATFLKRSFLNTNNLRYLKDVPYLEDGELMARIYCKAKRVNYIRGTLYVRTTRPGSATNSGLRQTQNARNGFLKAANNLLEFKHNYCNNEVEKIFMNQPIIHFTILFLTSLNGFKYLKQYSELQDILKKGPLKELDTEGCSIFYKKMGKYYNHSIHCFYLNRIFFLFRKALGIKLRKIFPV
ncbi:MAG: glycosyltransferase [Bacteroidales bacterium]|nr:glycosyltransferase [Bacteroidales bacterium]MCF8390269.1 glycosyltransferase [Bacteroidales bacterium]